MMVRRLASSALVKLLLVACVQDSAEMVDRQDQNGSGAGAAASTPLPRGTANARELTQRFPEAFEVCDGEAVQRWLGRQFAAASETELLKASGAATLRPVRPGQAISMDYQSDRLTIELDAADIILALRCG